MATREYEKQYCVGFYCKFNKKTDTDILEWLDRQDNKQGSIKTLIRWASAVDTVREAYAEALADEAFCRPAEAAYNAADNEATTIVWGWHGIKTPADVTKLPDWSSQQIKMERKLLMLASVGEE